VRDGNKEKLMHDIKHDLAAALLPARPDHGHKGTFGHLFIIAGARGFTGAAKLVCHAAERSGCGLVSVGVPDRVADVVAAGLLESMTLPLPDTPEGSLSEAALSHALAFAQDKKAVALGPGLTQHPDTAAFVRRFVVECPVPLVIDADGLNNLAGHTSLIRHRLAPTILTPHPGEMARLLERDTGAIQDDREKAASDLCAATGAVVILKGAGTLIAAPDSPLQRNTTGNDGMGKGGSGDVLTGLVGGLLAQGLDAPDAAALGVYAHGMAGDWAADQRGKRFMKAADIIEGLEHAWRTLESMP
jgi:NAD(P)H-hydrate epimerase